MTSNNAVRYLGTTFVGECGYDWDYRSLEKVENYEQAMNDPTQTWDMHHRAEVNEDIGLYVSREVLEHFGLYKDRHYSELVLLPSSKHHALHAKHLKETTTLDDITFGKVDAAALKAKLLSCIARMRFESTKRELEERFKMYSTAFNKNEEQRKRLLEAYGRGELKSTEMMAQLASLNYGEVEAKFKEHFELKALIDHYEDELAKCKEKCRRLSDCLSLQEDMSKL